MLHHHHQPRSVTHSSDHHRRMSPASPYSTPYLSPPDTWRRTNSDSALHQSSLMADRTDANASFMPHVAHGHQMSRRSPVHPGSSSLTNISYAGNGSAAQSTSGSWDVDRSSRLDEYGHGHVDEYHPDGTCRLDQYGQAVRPNRLDGYGHPDSRQEEFGHPVSLSSSLGTPGILLDTTGMMVPGGNSTNGCRAKSCEVPGIMIYPSPTEDGDGGGTNGANHAYIPIAANTGSLPDLTSFPSFPAPLSSPIDGEDQSPGGEGDNSPNNTHSDSSSQFAFQPNDNHSHSNGMTTTQPPSPFSTQRAPPSPYSVNSNSPYSPQSPPLFSVDPVEDVLTSNPFPFDFSVLEEQELQALASDMDRDINL